MKKLIVVSAAVFLAVAVEVMLVALLAGGGNDRPTEVKRTEIFEDGGFDATGVDGDGDAVKLGIEGAISYIIRDGDGNIKEDVVIHNETLDRLLNSAAVGLVAATTTGESVQYDNIQLCSNNSTGASCTIVDLNGDTGGAGNNPFDVTATTGIDAGGGDTVGTFEVQNTFTCTDSGGTCTAIEEIQLTSGPASDGTADTGIGAWQNVSMILNEDDTVQITWTVDID